MLIPSKQSINVYCYINLFLALHTLPKQWILSFKHIKLLSAFHTPCDFFFNRSCLLSGLSLPKISSTASLPSRLLVIVQSPIQMALPERPSLGRSDRLGPFSMQSRTFIRNLVHKRLLSVWFMISCLKVYLCHHTANLSRDELFSHLYVCSSKLGVGCWV